MYVKDDSKIAKCQTIRRGGLICKKHRIERNSRIYTSRDLVNHHIFFTLSNVSKLQLSRP